MTTDALVVGGGLFGCHAALFLAQQGLKVTLIELADELIQRASIVNQARLHAGYHYPRSIATAKTSDTYIERFRADFADCINEDFVHYYAIAQRGSLTDAAQFQHFCDYLSLKCDRLDNHPAFNYEQLEAVFAAREASFDPELLAERYRKEIAQNARVAVMTGSQVIAVTSSRLQSSKASSSIATSLAAHSGTYQVSIQQGNTVIQLSTPLVVNTTYAAINTINRAFGLADIPLQHEIAEMAFVQPDAAFEGAALTIMDGPFCSLMPYGKQGFHSLSSVAYTHQRVSYGAEPDFPICQGQNPSCSPNNTADCSTCRWQPQSNYPKMLSQLRRYLDPSIGLAYSHSRFTIKAKLQANHIDDGRPTAVRQLSQNPAFFCVFAGKINSIYAMEEPLLKALS